MLNKISWVGYAGSLTWSAMMAAVPGGAGLAMTVVGTNKVLNEVFRNTPPVALRRMNSEKLNAMGVDPQIADAFLNNTLFSPREQTLLVQALTEMDGATDRRALVRLALSAHDPTSTFFRTRQVQMYAGYNKWGDPAGDFHHVRSVCGGPHRQWGLGLQCAGRLSGLDGGRGGSHGRGESACEQAAEREGKATLAHGHAHSPGA
jgi:hypothetical protein